jgi:hypothetical protein
LGSIEPTSSRRRPRMEARIPRSAKVACLLFLSLPHLLERDDPQFLPPEGPAFFINTASTFNATSTTASKPEQESASVVGSEYGRRSVGNRGTPARKSHARLANSDALGCDGVQRDFPRSTSPLLACRGGGPCGGILLLSPCVRHEIYAKFTLIVR